MPREVASAAKTTEGAENAYYQVEASAGTEYYSTIAEAIEAVKDGGIITVLKDASEPGIVLSEGDEKNYTIDGAGKTLTLTENTKHNSSNPYYLYMRTGTITLKNLTLVPGEGATANGTSLIFLQNKQTSGQPKRSTHVGHLILDNVVSTIDNQYGIWIHRLCDLTIKGENTNIKGGSTNVIRVNANAVYSNITVEGGTLTGTVYLNPNAWSYELYDTNFTMTGGTLDGNIEISKSCSPMVHVIISTDATFTGTVSGAACDLQYNAMTGETTYVEGAHFYKVTPTEGYGGPFYFATLQEAIAALKGNATIEMLGNTAETAPDFNVPYSYTLEGNGYTMTLTSVKEKYLGSDAQNAVLHIQSGFVTIQNVTFTLAEGSTTDTLFYVQNAHGGDYPQTTVRLTLDNVVM